MGVFTGWQKLTFAIRLAQNNNDRTNYQQR